MRRRSLILLSLVPLTVVAVILGCETRTTPTGSAGLEKTGPDVRSLTCNTLSPCLDGYGIRENVPCVPNGNKRCTDCNAFNAYCTAAPAPYGWGYVKKDNSKPALCGRQNVMMSFATTANNYTSARLKFAVKGVYQSLDVTTPRIRVYARTTSTCEDMSNSDQYLCGTWTDVGAILVPGEGPYAFSIPNPSSVIGNGYTRFLLFDDSEFEGPGFGLQRERVMLSNYPDPAKRPVLELCRP